ncbi:hypothetical protein LCGC14_0355760 [marine sediment metagenome]|uniref:Uncharacterized protein n=1 Tax=marine sediment metagenome TaxID=412755 RepID=A0A0F9TF08_9ZZZZ
MKVELAVEKHGANVEFRASIVHGLDEVKTIGFMPGSSQRTDVVALPAVFQAHPVERHVRPKPLLAIPLEDAKRMAKQILGIGD